MFTVADFKTEFFRDFPYLSSIFWVITKQYFTDNEVYLESDQLFYRALKNSIGKQPDTNKKSWELFDESTFNYITDADIDKAMREADTVFNEALSCSDEEKKLQYLYLTAHYLCMDIRAAQSGINATGQGLVSSRSVGSVSESYSIPDAWTKSHILNYFTTSSYGLKYLSMVTPKMVGNVVPVGGATHA